MEADPNIYPETRATVDFGGRLDIDHIFVGGYKSVVQKVYWRDVDWDRSVTDHAPLVVEVEF